VTEKPKQKVLLVEDDPALRKLVKSHLDRMGLEVVEAADGRSALARLGEHAPDLVCLDLMLPESSGYEVCEFIRKTATLKHVPVLVMSARTLPEDRAHAEEVGASAYLIKPFNRATFTTQVSALLRTKP
jgi:DNA-binding response OmpR family regulator